MHVKDVESLPPVFKAAIAILALPTRVLLASQPITFFKKEAIQKLRNDQRGEGVDDFVTYRYIYFEGEEGIL